MANLISSITPADKDGNATGEAVTSILQPSSYHWGKSDISSPKAGRMANMAMRKMLIGKARTLELQWQNRSFSEISTVLALFDHEYVLLNYVDALTGTTKTSHMYMSDMAADCYHDYSGGMWEIATVSCIQATPDAV